MKTFYRIFGGKFLRLVLLCITLSAFTLVTAQPCSNLTISGNATICQGSNTNITFTITGGAPPWRVTYAIDGVVQPEITNINASPYLLTTGVAGTYTGVDVYDATNCQGQVLGAGATVVVNLPPVVNLGPDFYSCALGGIPLFPFVQNYSSVIWTATGNGIFSDPNSPNTTYYPGTNNISAGHATLTLTVYPLAPCTGSVSDQMTIYVIPGPTCNAGADATSCGTSGYTLSGTWALDYSSVSWISSGTGSFVNQASLTPTYYPSVADVAAGSVVLTLSAYGTGNCLTFAYSDEMILNLVPEPTVEAGTATVICEGSSLTINDANALNYSNLNWSTSGSGTFVNNGSLSPTYTPSAADISSGLVILTLTAFPVNPCSNPVNDSKTITFSLIPTVTAGPDGSVCDNNPFSITNAHTTNSTSVLWTTSGSGTFSNNTSINTTYTPGPSDIASGSVVLTLTAFGDPSCSLSASDNLLLTIVSSPIINAGSNGITCENSTYTILNASASEYSGIQWTSNGTGTLINSNTLSPSYIASNHDATVGSVTLTLSATGNPPCNNVVSDNMILTVIPLPTVDAGNNISSCSTAPVSIPGATANAYSSVTWTTSGSGTYSNANVLNPVYNPGASDVAAGSVVLTITANPLIPCSGTVSDNLVLTLTPSPSVYAGLDQTSCNGIHLISGSTASNYNSLVWTTSGTGIFSNATTLNPTYTASAQDIDNGSVNLLLTAQGESPCTMEATDYMVLTLPGLPIADAGLNGTVCENSEFYVTTASASNYGSLFWTTSGNGTFSGQNTLYPVYYPGTSDITNGSVILTLTAYSAAPCATFSTDHMTLNILPLPQANAGADFSICEGSQAFINGSVSHSSGHMWTTSGDGSFLNASTLTPTYVPGPSDLISGSVTITLTAYPAGTCTTSVFDHMILSIVKNPTVNAGNDMTICSNTITLLTSSAANYAGLFWTTSGSGSFIDATALNATYLASNSDIALGSITLTLTAAGNPPCFGSIFDQMILTFTPEPTVFAGQDATICENVSSYTIADAYATNYSLISWSTSGDGTFSNTAAVNPTYYPGPIDYNAGFVTLSVTATGTNFCNLTDTDEMILNFTSQPFANAGTDLFSCGTQAVQITDASASEYSAISWLHNGTGILFGASGLTPIYIPSQGDLIGGQVTLTLHAFPNSPCAGVITDQMIINLQAGPTASAGLDATICENQNVDLTTATASNYASLLWTTSGSGSFNNNTSLNPIYIPSPADAIAGSVILTLTADGISPCTAIVTDDMLLTIQRLPVANAGPDEFTCGNTHQLLQATAQYFTSVNWTTTGTGTFINSSLVNAIYIPSAADRLAGSVILTLTVNGQSPCNILSVDQMTLTIGETAMANAGPDGSTCGNSPFMITGSSASTFSSVNWVSTGTGTFTNQNTLNPTYTPSAGDLGLGSVILTMQIQGSAPCFNVAQDEMVLTIIPDATANAGPDAQICKGGLHTISGASASNYSSLIWTTSGSGSFVGGNTLSPTYIPGVADYIAGNVTLSLTAITQGPCSGGVTDEMLLIFLDGAIANAGPDAEICFGSNFTITGATAGNAALINWTTSGTGILQNAGTVSPTYIPSNGDRIAGSVTLIMTVTGNAPCLNTSTDFMVLTVSSSPVGIPVISGLQDVCAGQTGVTYSVFPVQYATAYNWILPAGATIVSGANTSSIVVDFSMSAVSGNITVYTTSSCGNGPVSADFPVNVNPLPGNPGIIMGPAVLCQNTTGVIYSINPVTDAISYQWTVPAGATIVSGIGTNSITIDYSTLAVSGTITVTPANGCGDGNTSSLDITVNPIPTTPVITANGPVEFCDGGSVVLSATPGYAAYLWSNGSTTQDITVTTSGTYSVTASDVNGCASLTSNEITVNAHNLTVPVITSSGPLAFCDGGNVTLSAPAGFASYLWSTGQTSQQITVTVSGVYNVTVTDAFGCSSLPSADVEVTVFPTPPAPVITPEGPITICEGENVTLTAPVGYATYLWSNGATTPAITVSASGNYSVIVSSTNGCPSVESNSVTVTVLPLPVIFAGSDANICQGSVYVISDASAINHTSVYWTTSGSGTFSNPASINPSYSPSLADAMNGSVALTFTVYGCTEVSDFMVLTITPQPTATTGGDLNICFAPAPVTGVTASGYSSLEWSVTFGSGTLTNQNNLIPTYMPAAGDLTAGYVLLTLTLYPESPCTAPLILNKTLYIQDTPTADAGIDETICSGSQLIITTANASNYASVQWSSSGTGTWLNANTLTPTYIPSNADINIGMVTLTLSASNGGCPDATDTMLLSIQPEATVNAGPDGTTCEGSNFNITGSSAMLYSSLLWTTSGSGTFSNATILNPVYTPGPADIAAGIVQLTLTGTSSAPCSGSNSDVLTLFIRQEPQANAGADGTICQGEQYLIMDAVAYDFSSLTWATSGSGFFINGTTLTPTYIPSQLDIISGSVVLTLIASNPPCADITDSQVLTITPTATVEAGPDVTICQTCSHTVSGAFVNNAQSFIWTSTGNGILTGENTFTPTYQPSNDDIANGAVTLILTAESYLGCGTFSDQMVIYINQNPNLDFSWDPICEGQETNFIVDEVITDINSIAVWHWNFGDGFYANVMNPSHTFPAIGTYNVTLTVTDTLGNSSSVTHIVQINSSPIAFFSFETPNCQNTSIQFNNLSSTENGYITRWVWNFGDGSPEETIFFPNDPNVEHTYTNSGIFEVTLNVMNSFGCENTWSTQVTITPNPIANFYYTTLCEDLLVNFQDASFPNGAGNVVSWDWNFDDPASGIFNTSNLEDPQHIFSAPGVYNVTLAITNFNNCNDTITKQITVGDAPAVEFTWQAACESNLTSFFTDPTVVNIDAIASYLWNFGDGGQSNLKDPQHMYSAAGNYLVTLMVTDTAGCTNSVSHPITVSPTPVAFFSFSAPTCLQSETFFNDQSYASSGFITEWEWIFGDGNSTIVYFPDNPNVSHIYANAGTYNVTLNITTSEGCENSVTLQVQITPNPVANFINSTTCLGEPVNFTDLSQANGSGQIVSWAWDFGDLASGVNNTSSLQNPSHIYSQAGSYSVSLTVTTANSCTDVITQVIVVDPAPFVDFVFTNGCAGNEVQFTSSTFVDPATTQSWLWNFGDGFTTGEPDPLHVYAIAGIYNVSLTITNLSGCKASVSYFVNVVEGPVAMFSFTTPACVGSEVAFNDNSFASGSTISQWHWDFGDGNTTTVNAPGNPDVTHTYAIAGMYSVTLTVTNLLGCDASSSMNVLISSGPLANFTIEQGCAETPTVFSDQSNPNGGPAIIQWSWNFGDPASGVNNTSGLQNPTHIFSGPGTFDVTLNITNINNCTSSITKQITVNTTPPVEFTWETSCANSLTSFFTDPTVVDLNAIATFAWEFGDGGVSNYQDPQYQYATAGNYLVTLTITDTTGCSNSVSHVIVISELPVAYFAYSEPTCFETETAFTDLSFATTGYITEWEWIFGDGNTTTVSFPNSPHVTHQYGNSGVYNVTLNITTSNGCENTVTRQVTVVPSPVANFISNVSCLGQPVTFTDLSQSNGGGQIVNWDWDFGDPTSGVNNTSSLQHPTHTFLQPGNYTVLLTVTTANSCTDTVTRVINIAPAPFVDFTSTSGCANDAVQFTSSTFVDMTTTLAWFWEFGDGSTSVLADPEHIYTSHGIYFVRLTITDIQGCTATVEHAVSIVPGPVAMFGFAAPACTGSDVQFNDLSVANGSVITSWLWDFGDGNTLLIMAPDNPNVSHLYTTPGLYPVTLTITNQLGCEASTILNVQIVPGPVAEFTFNEACQGNAVAFTDQSVANGGPAIVQWLWNFGDPASGISNTSDLQHPIHVYNTAGTFTVTLTTTSAGGCTNTVQHNVDITPPPAVGFLTTSGTCVTQPVLFEPDTTVMDLSSIVSFEWNFGDGTAVSNLQSPVHTYYVPGAFQITLSVINTEGCSNSITQTINIGAVPVAAFNFSSACSGNVTSFNDLSFTVTGEPIVSWLWNFNDPNALPGTDTSILQHPVYQYGQDGLYNVMLTVTSASGCSATTTMQVQIFPAPVAAFNYTTNPCANGTVSFQDASSSFQGAITGWLWEFAPGYTSTLMNPTHTFYHTDSCFNVKLIVTDMRGCTDTISQEVCIPAGLEVAIESNFTCHGDTTSFNPLLIAPAGDSLVAFQWNFDDPASGIQNTSTQRNPVHYFASPGSYLVSLLATDKNNCQTTVYERVEIMQLPLPSFTYTAGACDSTIYFTDQSFGNGSIINTWIWNYGDGSVDTIYVAPAGTTHFYQTTGIFSVSLTTITSSGCAATYTMDVDRMPCINAVFAQLDTLICERHELSFRDLSTCGNPIDKWEWIFGDGNSMVYYTPQPVVSHIYQQGGTYSVSLVVSTTVSGRTVSDTTSQTVRVLASPTAQFFAPDACMTQNTVFMDQSTWTDSKIQTWFWDFGDPTTVYDTTSIRNPAYRYVLPGNYPVSLTVTNQFGCTNTVSKTVNVYHLPVADFSYSLACQNNHTFFADHSYSADTAIDQWWWRFSDSITMLGLAGVQNPDFIFSHVGDYDVSLVIVDGHGCADTTLQTVTVNPKPISAFSYTENFENTQGRVQFINGSIGAKAYEWDFGTGIASFEINPVVNFPADGDYEISLITLNEFGCPDTLTMDYSFIYKGLWVPNAFSPNNPNPEVRMFKPVGVNLSTYTIEVYDTWGNILWTSSELDANGSPVEGWNGVFNGNLLHQDTYMWKATGVFKDGTIWRGNDVGNNLNMPQVPYGTITLVR
ncbi:MAG: PKD domain-containing protein [Lentimicrobium sp.]|nr:PKD domain-containing protein [Lentimicrobium sp.]